MVKILKPLGGEVFLAPADIPIVVDARDPDGHVRRLQFFANEVSLGVVEADSTGMGLMNPFQWKWPAVPPGDYVLTVKATDNAGASTFALPVRIRVVSISTDLPVVTIEATDQVATEQDANGGGLADTGKLVVHRTGSTDKELVVRLRIAGSMMGQATPGVDYETLPNSVTLPVGAAAAELVVRAIDDAIVEPDEGVVVGVAPPPSGPNVAPIYLVGRPAEAAVVIKDNDHAANQPPRVMLLMPPNGAVFAKPESIELVAAAHDWDGWVKSVEFFDGDTSLGKIVRDGPPGPGAIDPSHPEWGPILPFALKWGNPAVGPHRLTALATDNAEATTRSAVVEIVVMDGPPQPVVTVVATDPEGAEVAPGADGTVLANPAVFTIRRAGSTELALEVKFKIGGTAENGVDYTEIPLSATIPEGAASVDVMVNPIDDALAEGPEKVVLSLVQPPNPDVFPPPAGWYLVGRPSVAAVVVLDNEPVPDLPPVVELVHPHDGEIFPAGADIWLVARAGDRDGIVKSVEFFEGERSLGMGVLDPARGEGLYALNWLEVGEGNYVITAVATDDDGLTKTSVPVDIKVVKPQLPTVVTVVATDPEGAEIPPNSDQPSNPAVFKVRRTGPVTEPLTVYYKLGGTAENGVDYAKLPLSVTIPGGAEAAEVMVDPIDDDQAEGPETVVLNLVPSCCVTDPPATLHYIVGLPAQARAVILDNEAGVNLPPRVAITQPQSGRIYKAPAVVEIAAVGRDADGYVPKVEFFAGEEKIGEQVLMFLVPPPPGEDQFFNFKWENVRPGTYMLRARATDDRGGQSWSWPVGIVVVPAELPSMVTIVPVDPVAIEPTGDQPGDTATFVVHRTGDLTQALTVKYAVGGTAENGVDYEKFSGEVEVPEGRDSVRLVVQPLADNLAEVSETVVVELIELPVITIWPPPPGYYRLGELRRAAARILDPIPIVNRPPRVEIAKPYAGEMFQVPAEVKIVAMAGDMDGRVAKVEFFADGVKLGEQFASDTTPGTTDPERQAFTWTWVNAPAGRHVLRAVATDNQGATGSSREVPIVVLTASEAPVVRIVATDPYAAERPELLPPNTATFKVRRTGQLDRELRVFYSISGTAVNGQDYREIARSVLIPVGHRSASILIEPINDAENEPIETVILKLEPSPMAGPLETYKIGWPEKACAVIVDNDGPKDGLRPLPQDVAHICLPGETGLPFRIEASDDLLNWIPVADAVAVDGRVQFAQPGMQEFGHRFYRVRAIVMEALGLDD